MKRSTHTQMPTSMCQEIVRHNYGIKHYKKTKLNKGEDGEKGKKEKYHSVWINRNAMKWRHASGKRVDDLLEHLQKAELMGAVLNKYKVVYRACISIGRKKGNILWYIYLVVNVNPFEGAG